MRNALRIATVSLVLATAIGCSQPAPPEFRPTSTVKEIMDSIVDPNADGIWDSMETVATLTGTTVKVPQTDDDWKNIRRHAVAVLEATNLLLMPGRQIADPGQKAEDERIDLKPEEIEALIRKDPAAWVALVHGLHDAGMKNREAADTRDLTKLLEAGDALDTACENCHKKYWYRNDPNLYGLDPRALPQSSSEKPAEKK